MSVQVTDARLCALFCDTTDRAFGPVGPSHVLNEFIDWLPEDPRSYDADELDELFAKFLFLRGGKA